MVRVTRTVAGIGLLLVGALAGGCTERSKILWKYPHAERETLSETSQEHFHRVSRVDQWDRQAISEDLDVFFMTDRPSRLSKWHSK